jgi:hypothetical protein
VEPAVQAELRRRVVAQEQAEQVAVVAAGLAEREEEVPLQPLSSRDPT